ncbi:hypothetical protein CHUAL_014046 [Chamberlinius hualienensis]
MRILVVLCSLAVCYAAPQFAAPQFGAQPAQAAAPAPGTAAVGVGGIPAYTFIPSAQFHSQNELGGYNYGYVSADGQGKNELRGADGSVIGTYSYVDPSGQPVQVRYAAGPGGFTATGSHIPQPVPLPAANVQATQEHFAAKAVAAAKAAAAAAAAAPAPAAPAQQAVPAFIFG